MGKRMNREVLVIDVESTCWELPEIQPTDAISEVIEIGIALVDMDTYKMTANDCILIRPQRSKLSNFCTKLTTLTQGQVDTGCTFQEAMETMRKKYDAPNRTFVSWGDYDRKMFERNCQDYGVKYPFGPRHMNLKNSFAILHGLDREVGLDSALGKLGMPLEGTHHRGIDDARNIGNILIHTLRKFRNGRPGQTYGA